MRAARTGEAKSVPISAPFAPPTVRWFAVISMPLGGSITFGRSDSSSGPRQIGSRSHE